MTAPNKPRVVTICGSSRFCEIMAVCAWLIERDEHTITMSLHLLPWWYGMDDDHLAEAEGCANEMDSLHLRKIDLSDEVFVVNHDNYIGESTANEIRYATGRGTPIRYYNTDPVGDTVKNLMVEGLRRNREAS